MRQEKLVNEKNPIKYKYHLTFQIPKKYYLSMI
jgi:hypothetical protein